MFSKKLYYLLCAIPFVFSACKKDLSTHLNYESYNYSGIDENGGDWQPILIAESGDISIAEPSDVASDVYQAELSEIKRKMSDLTEDEQEQIEYWTNNSVNRWNEIALELIAKYNLIPGPNADGTYTLPNPNNPNGPPGFPFAHPPYASRVLAYLSVAQFDGLISAWHHKFTFNRPAPYQLDGSITYAYAPNTIPSYPSEDAVIATVSKEILIAMFPLEVDYITRLANEHQASMLLTGGYVQSDLDAGNKIGNEISAVAIARSKMDGMKNAQAPKAVSDSIKLAAFERFGWQWNNLEVPVRPVGLTPLFGKVKMWNVPSVELTRPIPPPAPGSDAYYEDVKILKDYADNITEEQRRIANFWQDGLGTYTPPGHWNKFAKEFAVQYRMNPLRTARTFAYMNMAIMDAGISCWDAKYYYHYPRPIQLIDDFKTIAGTPNFPSYTSGHSVFSAAGAEVLAYIFPAESGLVKGWAEEAAISRVYGGIHWTFDAFVGTDQGIDVASYTVAIAKLDGAD